MFDLDATTERRHAPEPDLVPILDGLTAVIFFMLLSLSFIGITKLTVPPSTTSVASVSNEVPVSGRLVAQVQGEIVNLRMEWIGPNPGSISEKATRLDPGQKNLDLVAAVEKLAIQFKEKFPAEKTIQIALAAKMNYQELISVMDGFRKDERYQDLVLSSYTEAE